MFNTLTFPTTWHTRCKYEAVPLAESSIGTASMSGCSPKTFKIEPSSSGRQVPVELSLSHRKYYKTQKHFLVGFNSNTHQQRLTYQQSKHVLPPTSLDRWMSEQHDSKMLQR